MRTYRGPELCAIAGITYRQLDYWARTGLMRPSVNEADGPGSRRVYSSSDLSRILLIKRLLDGGVNLPRVRDFLDLALDEDLESGYLVLTDEAAAIVETGEEMLEVLAGSAGVAQVVALPVVPLVQRGVA